MEDRGGAFRLAARSGKGHDGAASTESVASTQQRVVNLPKHDQNMQYEHILNCIRELEAGVLDTAKSNHLYATQLDSLSKLQPELEAAAKQNADMQRRLDEALERNCKLERETSTHDRARGDILAQLQQSLLREAEQRDRLQDLEMQHEKMESQMLQSDGHRSQLHSQIQRLGDKVKNLDEELAGSREVKRELAELLRQTQDNVQLQASEITQLTNQLQAAVQAARQMHFYVVPSQQLSHKHLVNLSRVHAPESTSDLDVLLREVQARSEALHRKSETADKLSEECSQLQCKINALQVELEEKNRREVASLEHMRAYEEELMNFQVVQKKLAAANAKLVDIESECSTLKSTSAAGLADAQATAEAIQASIDELRAKLTHQHGINAALQQKIDHLHAETSGLQSLVESHAAKESEHALQILQLKADNERLSSCLQESDDLRAKLEAKCDACAELEKKLQVRLNKTAEMQKEIEALEEVVAQEKHTSVTSRAAAVERQAANESLKRQLKMVTSDLQVRRRVVTIAAHITAKSDVGP